MKRAKLQEAFLVWDKNGDGFIDATEFKHIMCNMGEPMKEEEVDMIIADFDKDGDGKLNFDEFADFLVAGEE